MLSLHLELSIEYSTHQYLQHLKLLQPLLYGK